MWFKLITCGIKAAGPKKTSEVFLKYKCNECAFHVADDSLAAFCLPLGPESQTPKDRMAPEEYTFTLTQGDGTRVQGFCRRFLPPAPRIGSKLRYPQVLCLVCEASWSTLFFKVLEVVEQLLRQTDLLLDMSHKELPTDSTAGLFLTSLGSALEPQPALGSVIRVKLPAVGNLLSVSPAKRICAGADVEPLALTDEYLELQVPPDCGNGVSNAGVSLARLLWHVPVPAMLTLIASLLLERRVLVVGQSRDMVSAAVCGAAALIYPFRWHHIYLPLLPRSFKDYLTAPMPFLIGMPAQLLPSLKGIPMDEITLIDLDLGRCEPAPGSPPDDAALLPWKDQLEGALHAAFGLLRSPTEHESNPLITNIMQGYFLKLLGMYRSHIYPEALRPGSSPTPGLPTSMHESSSNSSLRSLNGVEAGPTGGRGDAASGRHTASSSMALDEGLRAYGYYFDHAALVASHRRNERARVFLGLLRQSQMYEVFIRERLEMEAATPGGPQCSSDPFEQLVNAYLDNRSRRLSARVGVGVRSGISRITAFVKKHRRTESSQQILGGGGGGSFTSTGGGLASLGGLPGLSLGGGAGGLSGSLAAPADSPEAQRLKALAAAFASAAVGAGQMRRNLTEGSNLVGLSSTMPAASNSSPVQRNHRHTFSSIEGLADHISSTLDPSAFFEDEDDDLDAEAEAAAAAAGSGSKMASRNSSSSSLKELFGSAPSWTAAAGGGSGSAASSGTSAAWGVLQQQQQQHQRADSPPFLQRRSVPVGSVAVEQPPRSNSPLIDLRDASAMPPPQQQQSRPQHHSGSSFLQQQQVHLQQQQQLQQPRRPSFSHISQQLQTGSSSMQGASPVHHQPQSNRLPLPAAAAALAATAGPGSAAAAAAAAASHRSSQHMHIKAALASIAPGPLPQPPQARSRAASFSANAAGTAGLSNVMTRPQQQQQQQYHSGSSFLQQQQQQPSQHLQQVDKLLLDSPASTTSSNSFNIAVGHIRGSSGSGSGSAASPVGKISVVDAAAVAAAAAAGSGSDNAAGSTWDPFLELLTERSAGAVAGSAAAAAQASVELLQFEQQGASRSGSSSSSRALSSSSSSRSTGGGGDAACSSNPFLLAASTAGEGNQAVPAVAVGSSSSSRLVDDIFDQLVGSAASQHPSVGGDSSGSAGISSSKAGGQGQHSSSVGIFADSSSAAAGSSNSRQEVSGVAGMPLLAGAKLQAPAVAVLAPPSGAAAAAAAQSSSGSVDAGLAQLEKLMMDQHLLDM